MSGEGEKTNLNKGWQPIKEGYQPIPQTISTPPTVNGGYQPTTNQAPSESQPAPPPSDP